MQVLPPVPSFAALQPPLTPRRHQREAVDAVLAAAESGSSRWRVTLPPGAGKTLVGTEVARLLGRRTVVLSPNTAIQGQWLRTWEAYDGPPASTKRDLRLGFTSLTYQSLAVFDEGRREAGGGEPDPEPLSHVERLHENGRALVETMREAGPLLLVLDECHHLLEVWGELLREVLDSLPDAVVLGLTATPPEAMTRAESDLTDALLGPVLFEARLPALVAEGVLAPYVELAWVVEPTREEGDWLAGQSRRFEELTTALFAPDFGSTTLPVWLQQRFVEPTTDGTTTWESLAVAQPALCDAVLRLARRDLVPLPEGAVLRERHRESPDAEDWRLVIDDWLRGCIQPRAEGEGETAEADQRVLAAVRAALPSIGYVWTSRGVRAGRGTVDRVTARSRAKETAVTQVVGAELAHLGSRARVLVLCDHERATATTGAHLGERSGDSEPPPRPAGSATGVLETLVDDAVAAGLDPVLVTGRTVAGAPATLARFVDWLAETHPMLAGSLEVVPGIEDVGVVGDLARLEGRWTSSQWVTHLTAWFGEGGTQCLVGTRGLLGEGWDAPSVTTLVDLTTVTTGTAVVQTRGRALRLDPDHPEKVAQIWSVVCVHDGHVAGGADWDRFARKHRGHFSVDEQGLVVDGVAGVDSTFSEHHPPPVAELDAIGARMLVRAEDRDGVRAAWRDRDPDADRDRVGHLVRVRETRRTDRASTRPVTGADGERPLAETVRSWQQQRAERPGRAWAAGPPVAAVVLLVVLGLLGAPVVALVVAGLVLAAVAATGVVALLGRAALQGAADHEVTVATVAAAVADGLHRAGALPAGAEAVLTRTSPDGRLGFLLRTDDEAASARYAEALEEVLAPLTSPRYVVPRRTHAAPRGVEGLRRGLADRGRQLDHDRAWHAVPSAVAGHRRTADAYAAAWDHWVGGGDAVYAHSPEGTGILAAHRGSDPFGAECTVRRTWG